MCSVAHAHGDEQRGDRPMHNVGKTLGSSSECREAFPGNISRLDPSTDCLDGEVAPSIKENITLGPSKYVYSSIQSSYGHNTMIPWYGVVLRRSLPTFFS